MTARLSVGRPLQLSGARFIKNRKSQPDSACVTNSLCSQS